MTAETPVIECPDIAALTTTDHAVHLIVGIDGNWETEREALSAEVLRKTQAATAYAASAAFRKRFFPRIGVVRVKTSTEAPSIVAHLLAEQGIELENLGAARPQDGPSCIFCGREPLSSEQATMTDRGIACPSCFRAWNVKLTPELLKKPRQFRIPARLLFLLILLVAALFVTGAYYELGRLNKMNRIIRSHLPSE